MRKRIRKQKGSKKLQWRNLSTKIKRKERKRRKKKKEKEAGNKKRKRARKRVRTARKGTKQTI